MSEEIQLYNSGIPSIINHEEYKVFIERYSIIRYSEIQKLGDGPEWQTEEEADFQKRSFPNFTTFHYLDRFVRIKSIVNTIKNSIDYSKNEKISLLKNYDLSLTSDTKNNPVRKALNKLYKEICEEYSIDFEQLIYSDKCTDKADELIEKCLENNNDYKWLKDFDAMILLNDNQILAGRMLIQEVITELINPETIKPQKKPHKNKYSLSQTVFIFDMLRDVELISPSISNKAISESIQDLTGFSSKQAVNQFAINSDQENNKKLKMETIEFLQSIIERLK